MRRGGILAPLSQKGAVPTGRCERGDRFRAFQMESMQPLQPSIPNRWGMKRLKTLTLMRLDPQNHVNINHGTLLSHGSIGQLKG